MPVRPLTLVSFAAASDGEQLCRALTSGGYRVVARGGHEWIAANGAAAPAPLVLFIAQPHYPRQDIVAALAARAIPCFGVCHRDVAPWDEEILSYCGEFACWPCRPEELGLRLERLIPWSALEALRESEDRLRAEFLRLSMVGRSPEFLAALRVIRKMAAYDACVLIEGETGTGKEMAARAIHYLGARRDRPFIPVNCGAIPDNLFESELFGHTRGAFTDAKEAQAGLVALAEGGTLFLDEVDALSGKGQVALLRFLQDQRYRPLGGRDLRRANVRVLAAANSDLTAASEAGRFRPDLLFRLRVLSLSLPPLRRRRDDIVLLAEYFLEEYRQCYRQPHKRFSPELSRWLSGQPWPGNVRELESFVHREFVLADGDLIGLRPELGGWRERRLNALDRRAAAAEDIPALKEYKARAIADFEKRYLTRLIAECGGNVSFAARRAGKERRALGKLLKKYGLTPRPTAASD